MQNVYIYIYIHIIYIHTFYSIYIHTFIFGNRIYIYIHIIYIHTFYSVYIYTHSFLVTVYIYIYIRERFRFWPILSTLPRISLIFYHSARFWGEDCCQDRWNWWRPQDQWQPQRESVPRFGRSKTSVKIKGNRIIQLNPRYEFHQHKYLYLKQQPFLF